MSQSRCYRTLFTGTLRQDSFLSVGGTEDPKTTVDSPFCRDGANRPTLRGSGLAGALISTLRRCLKSRKLKVPDYISGSERGEQSSSWRCFNAHPSAANVRFDYRQHVAIDAQTGAAASGALFNVETLPPGTEWFFLLEVDTFREPDAAPHAREALAHWAAGRCLLGREVARGLGWLTLTNLREYTLTTDHVDQWPNSQASDRYESYIRESFHSQSEAVQPTAEPLPGTTEISGRLIAGIRDDGYGIDSLSIGGHDAEDLAAAWNDKYLCPEGIDPEKIRFDPDMAVVTVKQGGLPEPYLPGSSIRGAMRHALARFIQKDSGFTQALHDTLFGTQASSAKLLICDAFLENDDYSLAWLSQHAEDEFTASTYDSSLFNRVALVEGSFSWRMLLEDTPEEWLAPLFALGKTHQIGLGGGQWRGHGWLRWELNEQGGHEAE